MTTREAVIEEALTWLTTPWHHAAGVKGAGVDCVNLLAEVYTAVGLMERPIIPYYPQDIMMHRNKETCLCEIEKYTHEVDEPMPGDIVLWKFGRIQSHAGIIIDWPTVIHSYKQCGMVTLDDATKGALGQRVPRFFSPWSGK